MTVLSRLEIVLAANSASFTQSIEDARSQTKIAFNDMRESANKMGPAVGASIGAAAAATTALVVEQVALANELQNTANVANSSIKEIQRYTVGAKKMGIEQDALGAIFQDTSDKIGDFLSTGGGGMADFFENIAPQIGVTAEEFRNLSGPQALQLYYDSLERANIGQNEMTFYMEAMASDATTLIPLLADGGAGFDTWATAAANAGAVMDAETIRATKELQATTDLLELSVEGAKTQFVAGFIPVLSDAAGELVGTADAADTARLAGENLGQGLKSVSKIGVGVVTVFETIGTALGGFAAGVAQLGNGVDWDSPFAFFQMGQNFLENNRSAAQIFAEIPGDISNIWLKSADQINRIDKLGTGTANQTINSVMQLNERQATLNRTLGMTGQQYQAQQEAAESAAKSAEKAAKSAVKNIQAQAVNSKVLAQAKQFSYGNLEQQYGLPTGLLSAVSMQESRGNANARSPVGASGAFQFMPGTADRFGIRGQESNVGKSAEAAAKYLSFLMNKFGSVDLALAGYNAGEGNVAKYGNKIPPFKETQNYVKKVNAYLAFMKGGLDGSVNIASNIAAQTAVIEREAAEQVRILEQQAKDRVAIRLEYSDEATRIEEQLKTNILKISASGFSDDERDAFIADAIDIANAKLAQMQLTHDREMQYAQQSEQTDAERIRNQYALERREIQLTVNMDEQLRTAKIDALNQAEQLALDERRYAFESELRQLTSIGQSELAALRQSYADQRRVLDARTDINDGQKSGLRNAMAGAQIYDTNQLQKGPRDAFESQQAEMGGTSEEYGLTQQYQSRLDVIKAAMEAEIATKQQARDAEFAAQTEHENAMLQLRIGQAEGIAGSLSAITKDTFGEQSKIHQAMFIGEKILAVGRSVMNIQVAMSSAAASLPFPANLGAMATVATNVAGIISTISSLKPPPVQGQAHDGLDYVPKEGTWMLDEGERVVKPADNRKLTEFLDSNAPTTKRFRPELEATHDGSYDKKYRNQSVNINITNNAPVDVKTSVNDDGSIEMRIDKRLNQRLPQAMVQQINNPYSETNDALKRNYHLQRKL